MKAKLFALLLFNLPLLVCAQTPNYEQQGDELFAQAQYEKAAKKYDAAIVSLDMEEQVPSAQLKQKKETAKKCASLLQKAISSEGDKQYVEAEKDYSELYSLHALQVYSAKIGDIKNKIAAEKNKKIWKWVRLSEIKNNKTSYKFKKMRLHFDKFSVPEYSYCQIMYDGNNKVAIEFSFKKSSGNYLIERQRINKQIIEQGEYIGNNTYEYDLNNLCGTIEQLFYFSSWQENFLPEKVEIYTIWR